jgi:hypothetical protein
MSNEQSRPSIPEAKHSWFPSRDQAINKIAAHYAEFAPGSPQQLAFSDYTDRQRYIWLYNNSRADENVYAAKVADIDRRISSRQQLAGYKEEFTSIPGLLRTSGLVDALIEDVKSARPLTPTFVCLEKAQKAIAQPQEPQKSSK